MTTKVAIWLTSEVLITVTPEISPEPVNGNPIEALSLVHVNPETPPVLVVTKSTSNVSPTHKICDPG